MRRETFVGLVCLILAARVAAAQTPLTTVFTYQGELHAMGTPADGPHDLRFRLYDSAMGGLQVGPTLCREDVDVAAGRFTVELDFQAAFAGFQRFLEVDVRPGAGVTCADATGYATLAPRQSLRAAPNSIYSLSAATATNATQLNGQAATFYQNATNLSTGTISNARLATTVTLLNSPQTFTGLKTFNAGLSTSTFTLSTGAGIGRVLTSNASGAGSWQDPTLALPIDATASIGGAAAFKITNTNGGGYAILGVSTFNSTAAVAGMSIATFGVNSGVFGMSASPSGKGVHGQVTATSGSTYGGYFECASMTGIGVYAETTATSGVSTAGDFVSNSSIGIGVSGFASAPTGGNTGGLFQSNSPGGYGLISNELATSGSNYAGYFYNTSTSGTGVYGRAAAASGATKAVWGECTSPAGTALFATGNFSATGTKAFQIDHPLDPENMYLLHYCAESPEVINFYSGNVELNDQGAAEVTLPPYFAAINSDPRYTLTAIGAAMPMLHIANEIDEGALQAARAVNPGQELPKCAFSIAGGAPGGRVSWEVKAVRADRWVVSHGAPVEVKKQGDEKGMYQHPDLYGKPPQRSVSFASAATHPVATKPIR